MSAGRAPRRLALAALLLSAALVLLALAGPANAGPEPVGEGSTADNAQRKAAWAPDGTLYVTYVQDVDAVPQVFVKRTRDGGAIWTILPRLSTDEAFRPTVAVGQDGTLHAAWSEFVDGVRQVFTARWEGGPDWVDSEQVSFTPGYSGFPALGLDATGRVHLVWYGFDGQTYRIHYRTHAPGEPWSATVVISRGVADANSPSMGVEPDGTLHVAFFASVRGVAQVWYLHKGASGWDDPELVSPVDEQSLRPSLAVFPSGVPAVAYVVTGHGVPQVVFSKREGPGHWSAWTALSDVGEGGDNPSLALGADGEGAAFFETPDGHLRVAALTGGSWGPARPVEANTPARWPSASWTMFPEASAREPTFLVWTEGDPDSGYKLAWTTAEAFAPPPVPPRPAQSLPVEPAIVAVAITALALATVAAASRRRRPPEGGDPRVGGGPPAGGGPPGEPGR